ncbi:hypothetical protein Tco_0116809 [Tanacetum coccineum]
MHPSGLLHILAFQGPDEYTQQFFDGECRLASSKDLSVVEFIYSGVNASFSINKAVVEFFEHLTNLTSSLNSKRSQYKPFGTFLFCTESGGHAAFEDHEAILEESNNLSNTPVDLNQQEIKPNQD